MYCLLTSQSNVVGSHSEGAQGSFYLVTAPVRTHSVAIQKGWPGPQVLSLTAS